MSTAPWKNKQAEILERYNIFYLYHLTHIENLPNIMNYGLMSHNQARENNLIISDISDPNVNSRRDRIEPVNSRNLHDYVPLYFNPRNPMLFVRRNIQEDIVILCIDSKIMFDYNCIFTDGNAASNCTNFYCDFRDLDKLNWDCIDGTYWNNFSDGRRIRCAEVLIYPKVTTAYIKKILCFNSKYEHIIRTMIINETNIRLC